ncbi:hypothetical protein BKA69DRAFT_1089973 [Paraphysoderma sedebokerense]|nr:hypothetical protein BKA69DRAFT_1089973 [Paraphysoderma sedebokerense]
MNIRYTLSLAICALGLVSFVAAHPHSLPKRSENERTMILVKVSNSTQLSSNYKFLQVYLRAGTTKSAESIPILSYPNTLNPITKLVKEQKKPLDWKNNNGIMEYVSKDSNIWNDEVRKLYGSDPDYHKHGWGLISVAPGSCSLTFY